MANQRKAKPKLFVPDERMLGLMEYLKQKSTIRFNQEFCDAIGLQKQNLVNIRNGTQYFTVDHIAQACKTYNLNANWVLGLSDEMHQRKAKIRFLSDGIAANKAANKAGKKTKKSSSK